LEPNAPSSAICTFYCTVALSVLMSCSYTDITSFTYSKQKYLFDTLRRETLCNVVIALAGGDSGVLVCVIVYVQESHIAKKKPRKEQGRNKL